MTLERVVTLEREVLARLDRIGLGRTARIIAAEACVDVEAMLSRDRHSSAVRARRRLIAIVRSSTSLSLPEIGIMFGLDHMSVLSAIRVRDAELAREFGS